MQKELLIQRTELDELADHLTGTFIRRHDMYAQQRDDGRYLCIREPLRPELIHDHLNGHITLGAYVLDAESHARYIVYDADDAAWMDQLLQMGEAIKREGVTAYVEKSRRGGHLWLFFESDISGKDARAFGAGLLAYHDIENVELFPKQNRLFSGPGSLIRLPFGVHRKSGRRYGFYHVDGRPLASTLREQIRLLATPHTVPLPFFEQFRDYAVQGEAELYRGSAATKNITQVEIDDDMPVSKRIKAAAPLRPFVENFVQLSTQGTGLCPFHDDNAASFSINEAGNYWHRFACGIGGSVIDFWMHWRDCDFKTALAELAEMVLA